jgi:hypothetical protein
LPNAKKPKARKGHPPSKQRKGSSATSKALARRQHPSQLALPERMETALMMGDFSALTVHERLQYQKTLCKTLGLNPLTRPFEYIRFRNRDDDEEGAEPTEGKMVLYARADCAAQLRKIHRVAVKVGRRELVGEFYEVEADASIGRDRTDSAIGVVWMKKWKKQREKQSILVDLQGREKANAMMRAETKAKRRVTLSICGLHMLDQSELQDLDVEYAEVSSTGRTVEVIAPSEQKALPARELCYDVAVMLAQARARKGELTLPFKESVAAIEKELAKQTPAQLEELQRRFTTPPSSPAPPAPAKVEGAGTAPKAPAAPGPAPAPFDGLMIVGRQDGRYTIDGPRDLCAKHKDLLRPLWSDEDEALMLSDGTAAGKFCNRLEQAKIPYRIEPWSGREPGE